MDAFWEVFSFWTLQSVILISLAFFCGSNKKSKTPVTTPNGGISTTSNQPNPKDPGRQSENVPGGKSEKEKKSKKDGEKRESEDKQDKEKKKEMKEEKKENKKEDKDKPRSAIAVPTVRPAPDTDKGSNEKHLVSNPIVSNVTELYPTVVKYVEDLPVEKTQGSVEKSGKK